MTIHTQYIWNLKHATLKHLPSSVKENQTVDVLASDEYDELLLDPVKIRNNYVAVQRMIDSALQIFYKLSRKDGLEAW